MELKINKRLEDRIAKMFPAEYETLKASIKLRGQEEPIEVMRDGTIIDGHHRFKICNELGLDPKYKVLEHIKTLEEAENYAVVINIARRHLNSFQKAEMGMALLEVEEELAKQRQGTRTDLGKTLPANAGEVGEKTDIVAKKIGLSKGTFERAKKIIEKAPEKLKDIVRNEDLSISQTYKLVTALEDVPKKTKETFETNVIEATKPDEEVVKILNIISKTNEAKGYLENTSEEVAKTIEPEYKDLYYTEKLDPGQVQHDVRIGEGVQVKLKKVYLPVETFTNEVEADKYFKKFGGRCLGKVTIEMWAGEVDPYEWKNRED